LLRRMLTDISLHPTKEDSDEVPSFEGNQGIQGVAAGMAEMLIQSQGGEIRLLPALPKAWPSGKADGVRARGGFIVDVAWVGGKLSWVKIVSTEGHPCRLSYGGKTITFATKPGQSYVKNAELE